VKAETARRVVLIGLDGADFEKVSAWRPRLPFLDELISRGGVGPLASTLPPFTLTAWSTAMSGMNPGRTGVNCFPGRDFAREPIEVDSGSVAVPRIWDVAGAAGRKSIVLNVPLTYPPPRVDGCLVSGFMTPSGAETFTWPDALRGELPKNYRTSLGFAQHRSEPDYFLRHLYDLTDTQFEAADALLAGRPWDVFVFVVSGTDWVQHYFCRGPGEPGSAQGEERILEYYRHVDEKLARLSRKFEDADILIISDHGFGKIPSRAAAVNAWLAREGFLTPRGGGTHRLLAASRLRKLPLAGLARRVLPVRVREKVARAGRPTRNAFDWEATRAHFALFMNHTGYIRIDRGEREATKRLLEEKLGEFNRTAPGGPVFARVVAREDEFAGPFRDAFPDIFLEFAPEWIGTENPSGRIFSEIPPGGRAAATHRSRGILIAAGPSIRRDWRTRSSLEDVAPTVYHLLGLELPEATDGRVLEEIFRPEADAARRSPRRRAYEYTPARTGTYSPEDREDLQKRLAALGYLD